MAVEFVSLRDASERGCQLLPPAETAHFDHLKALAPSGRSFFVLTNHKGASYAGCQKSKYC